MTGLLTTGWTTASVVAIMEGGTVRGTPEKYSNRNK
jgi:hypothetical protein